VVLRQQMMFAWILLTDVRLIHMYMDVMSRHVYTIVNANMNWMDHYEKNCQTYGPSVRLIATDSYPEFELANRLVTGTNRSTLSASAALR
jgi:hypothetical protein